METEMGKFKMGEFPHQNIRMELIDMQKKGMPILGIQMRSQAMLNVASVILKEIKTRRHQKIYLVYSEVLLKKKRKISVNNMGKTTKRMRIYWKIHI